MRRSVRFLTGILAGTGLLAGYLSTVGVETVLARATAIAPWALALVVVLVVLEGIADGLGVWASIAPLGEGLSGPRSVQFALAGDFFDILSPAGPVSSEPIMARFFSVATETGYSDALGVRSVAKYIKSITQVLCSALVGLAVLAESPDAATILTMLGLSVVGLVVVAVLVLTARGSLSSVLVAACTPVVARLSALYREDAHDRSVVSAAIDRYWERIVAFRGRPGLLVLIALGGVFEQLLTAVAIWIALAGTGTTVSLLPIFVVVPLPQVASVVPVPGSLGAYDLLLAGALVVVTDAPAAGATAAVLVVRTVALPFGAVTGGICAVSLRGWRPSLGG